MSPRDPRLEPTAGMSRRGFLRAAGAGVAGATLLGATGCDGVLPGESSRPNVLLLVIDTLRADYVGAFGADRIQTPHMDAIAGQGIRFTRTYPEAMATVPARRSIFTGRRVFPFRDWEYVPELGQSPGWEPIADLETSLHRTLAKAGYWTGHVTDNPHTGFTQPYRPFRESFDRSISIEGHVGTRRPPSVVSDEVLLSWLPPGLRVPRYLDGVRRYLANNGGGVDDSESCAARTYRKAADLLDEAALRRPFAMVVDCFTPHEPWTPPRELIDMYGDPDYTGPEPSDAMYAPADYVDADVLRRMRAVYAAAVTSMDRWLGEFMERFRALGLDRDTAIVLVGDHGFLLGEHGWTGKIPTFLEPELSQVPLVVVHPERKRAGRTSDYFASLHDIAPTLLSMAGVSAPQGMQGADLSPLFEGGQAPSREFAYGGYYNHLYLRTQEWSLIANTRNRKRRLYDRALDPRETENVIRRNRRTYDELYAALLEEIGGPAPYWLGPGKLG